MSLVDSWNEMAGKISPSRAMIAIDQSIVDSNEANREPIRPHPDPWSGRMSLSDKWNAMSDNISPSKTIILDDQHIVYIDEAHPLRGALTLPLVLDAIAYWACGSCALRARREAFHHWFCWSMRARHKYTLNRMALSCADFLGWAKAQPGWLRNDESAERLAGMLESHMQTTLLGRGLKDQHGRPAETLKPSRHVLAVDQSIVDLNEVNPLRGALTLPLVVDTIATWAGDLCALRARRDSFCHWFNWSLRVGRKSKLKVVEAAARQARREADRAKATMAATTATLSKREKAVIARETALAAMEKAASRMRLEADERAARTRADADERAAAFSLLECSARDKSAARARLEADLAATAMREEARQAFERETARLAAAMEATAAAAAAKATMPVMEALAARIAVVSQREQRASEREQRASAREAAVAANEAALEQRAREVAAITGEALQTVAVAKRVTCDAGGKERRAEAMVAAAIAVEEEETVHKAAKAAAEAAAAAHSAVHGRRAAEVEATEARATEQQLRQRLKQLERSKEKLEAANAANAYHAHKLRARAQAQAQAEQVALLAKAKGETQHMHARLRESRLAERVSGLQAERAREDAEATYRARRECSASATQTPQGGVHHGSGYAVWVNTPAADAVYFVREHAVEGAEETAICEGAEGATPSQYLQRVSSAATLTPPCASLRKEASPRVTVLPASMGSPRTPRTPLVPPPPLAGPPPPLGPSSSSSPALGTVMRWRSPRPTWCFRAL